MWKRYGLLMLLLVSMRVVAGCGEVPIKFAQLDWESGQFTTALLRLLADEGYGCKTETIPGTTAALEAALVEGDIDVIAEQWDGRSPVMAKAEEAGRVKIEGNVMAGGAKQGWYVPRYVAEQYPQLQSAADLREYAHVFTDPNNPRQARFLNCPSGWACEVFNTRLLANLGLQKELANVHPGTGAALDAAINSAYTQKQPILFYYWQPTALMAKYDLVALKFPSYDKTCWDDLLEAKGRSSCVSGFPVSKLAVAMSSGFAREHADLAAMFARVSLPAYDLNAAILAMTEGKRSADEVAREYLAAHPDLAQQWLGEKAGETFQVALDEAAPDEEKSWFPQWSVASWMNQLVAHWVAEYGVFFRSVSAAVLAYVLLPLERSLLVLPFWLVLFGVVVLAWHSTRRVGFTLMCALGLFVIGALGLWQALMQTVALLIAAVAITVVLGVPLGILMVRGKWIERIMLPLLDVMQTMPGFVYLIPVLMLFGLGKVPALFATVVYAIAPLIRLTALGIRQVPKPLIEAGTAFGSSRWQMLFWVILPQALPSIMAGINQAVIMSLSMVVLASMIGAPGLGEPVLQAIQTQNIGQGVETGVAIVILAMIIDRITQAYGKRGRV